MKFFVCAILLIPFFLFAKEQKIFQVEEHKAVLLKEILSDKKSDKKKKIYREPITDPKEERLLQKTREEDEEKKSRVVKKESLIHIPEEQVRGRPLEPGAPFVLPEKPQK